jgi:hypothetical protein
MGLFDDVLSGARERAAPSLFADVLRAPAAHAGMSRFDEPSAAAAAERGFMTGATFNFYDELAGLMRAGGASAEEVDEYKGELGSTHPLAFLVRGAYRKFSGDQEAERLYAEERDRQRAITRQLEEAHPIASTVGGLGGALAIPIGTAVRGATLGARALSGARSGAVVGSVSGFGAGEDLSGSVTGAALGVPLGAAVGGVAPPLIENFGIVLCWV